MAVGSKAGTAIHATYSSAGRPRNARRSPMNELDGDLVIESGDEIILVGDVDAVRFRGFDYFTGKLLAARLVGDTWFAIVTRASEVDVVKTIANMR
jgi:hypothetical protein